jgi:hypothetical protein
MGSRVIRVDAEVYAKILEVKARLEAATGRVQSIGDTVAFLVAMSMPSDRAREPED